MSRAPTRQSARRHVRVLEVAGEWGVWDGPGSRRASGQHQPPAPQAPLDPRELVSFLRGRSCQGMGPSAVCELHGG